MKSLQSHPRASIIIVTYNGRSYLRDCLDSLLLEVNQYDEIIVVDNNSKDGGPEFVAEQYPQVKLIRQETNSGFVRGCNLGASHAGGEIFVFLNQDTKVKPGWLEGLADGLRDERVGMTTSKILLMHEPDRLHLAGQDVHYTGLVFGRGYRDLASSWQQSGSVSAVSGASFAIKRSVWERLGGMDGLFFMYYEETDLSWRALLQGLECRYMPNSIVYHDYRPDRPSYNRLYHTFRNRYLLLLKNYRHFTIWLVWPGLALTEAFEWGIALSYGKLGLLAKLSAMRWLVCERATIKIMWANAQSQRQETDGELLSNLSNQLLPQAMPGGFLGLSILLAANAIYRFNYLTAVAICRWRG